MSSYSLPNKIDNKKVSKKEIVNYIISYFENKGRRLTNVKRASMEQLCDIVVKYKLDDNLVDSIKEQRLQVIRDKEEQKKRVEERKIREKQREIEQIEKQKRDIETINSYNQKFIEIVKLKHNVVKHIEYLEMEKRDEILRLEKIKSVPKNIAFFKNKMKTDNVYYDYEKHAYVVKGLHIHMGYSPSNITLQQFLQNNKYQDNVLVIYDEYNKEFMKLNSHFTPKKPVKIKFVFKKKLTI